MFSYLVHKTGDEKDSDDVRFFFRGEEVRGFGYRGKDVDSIVCIIKCPDCGAENYGPAVASGRCAWCGFNPNTDATEQYS